jgi:hypothetical protein
VTAKNLESHLTLHNNQLDTQEIKEVGQENGNKQVGTFKKLCKVKQPTKKSVWTS